MSELTYDDSEKERKNKEVRKNRDKRVISVDSAKDSAESMQKSDQKSSVNSSRTRLKKEINDKKEHLAQSVHNSSEQNTVHENAAHADVNTEAETAQRPTRRVTRRRVVRATGAAGSTVKLTIEDAAPISSRVTRKRFVAEDSAKDNTKSDDEKILEARDTAITSNSVESHEEQGRIHSDIGTELLSGSKNAVKLRRSTRKNEKNLLENENGTAEQKLVEQKVTDQKVTGQKIVDQKSSHHAAASGKSAEENPTNAQSLKEKSQQENAIQSYPQQVNPEDSMSHIEDNSAISVSGVDSAVDIGEEKNSLSQSRESEFSRESGSFGESAKSSTKNFDDLGNAPSEVKKLVHSRRSRLNLFSENHTENVQNYPSYTFSKNSHFSHFDNQPLSWNSGAFLVDSSKSAINSRYQGHNSHHKVGSLLFQEPVLPLKNSDYRAKNDYLDADKNAEKDSRGKSRHSSLVSLDNDEPILRKRRMRIHGSRVECDDKGLSTENLTAEYSDAKNVRGEEDEKLLRRRKGSKNRLSHSEHDVNVEQKRENSTKNTQSMLDLESDIDELISDYVLNNENNIADTSNSGEKKRSGLKKKRSTDDRHQYDDDEDLNDSIDSIVAEYIDDIPFKSSRRLSAQERRAIQEVENIEHDLLHDDIDYLPIDSEYEEADHEYSEYEKRYVAHDSDERENYEDSESVRRTKRRRTRRGHSHSDEDYNREDYDSDKYDDQQYADLSYDDKKYAGKSRSLHDLDDDMHDDEDETRRSTHHSARTARSDSEEEETQEFTCRRRRTRRKNSDDLDGKTTSDLTSQKSSHKSRAQKNNEDTGEEVSRSRADSILDEEDPVIRRRRRRRNRGGFDVASEDFSASLSAPKEFSGDYRSRKQQYIDGITDIEGSTRLEAKKQRRRDNRRDRFKQNHLLEQDFLARRENIERLMVVRERDLHTQISVLEDNILVEHYVSEIQEVSNVGNIYLGRIQNVLPSMEAAFVDIGLLRNGVLYAGEANWDTARLEGQPKRIELAYKAHDPVLVQVTKDPIGHKGARLTSQVTLAGRFLVLVPSGTMTGVSRKLPERERARLKSIVAKIAPKDMGVIIRTAAEGASEESITADLNNLIVRWQKITEKRDLYLHGKTPKLLQGEPDMAIRVVRDIFNDDFSEMLVEGDGVYDRIVEYIDSTAPELRSRIKKWEPSEHRGKDVFDRWQIDSQLRKCMERQVYLQSGGSIVIDRTEAMTTIDVNTGRFIGHGQSLEETVTRCNLEAAEEIARQLRVRDIGGMVMIDFVDMVMPANRDLVLRRLVECLARDRTRHQVAEVSSLGLVQMTRKRIGQGLVEAFSEECPTCLGRGFIVHDEPTVSSEYDDPYARRGGDPFVRTTKYINNSSTENVVPRGSNPETKAKFAQIAAAAVTANESDELEEGKVPAKDYVAEKNQEEVQQGETRQEKTNDSSQSDQKSEQVNEHESEQQSEKTPKKSSKSKSLSTKTKKSVKKKDNVEENMSVSADSRLTSSENVQDSKNIQDNADLSQESQETELNANSAAHSAREENTLTAEHYESLNAAHKAAGEADHDQAHKESKNDVSEPLDDAYNRDNSSQETPRHLEDTHKNSSTSLEIVSADDPIFDEDFGVNRDAMHSKRKKSLKKAVCKRRS